MNSNRKASIIAGVLFIIGTVAGLLSVVPVIDDTNYLIKVSENANQVLIGSFFQFIMTAAYIGIAITLHPTLKKYNESLALGFVSFRIVAGVFIIIGVINLLLILTLSQEVVKSGTPDLLYFKALGELLRTGRDLVNHVAMILALSVGGLMLYYLLYQTKLVPRWLSGWGLVGTALTILASLLFMFHFIELVSTTYLVLNFPMALQEMVLAVFLIIKGFNPSVIASEPTKNIDKI